MKDNRDKYKPLSPADEKLGEVLANGLPEVETGECPSSEEIAAFLEGRLSGIKRDKLLLHLSSCSRCSEVFLLAADLHHEGGEARRREGNPALLFRPLALAASILIVAFSLYLFFRSGAPKSPRELPEANGESSQQEEMAAETGRAKTLSVPEAPPESAAYSDYRDTKKPGELQAQEKSTLPKAGKSSPSSLGEERGKRPPAEKGRRTYTIPRRDALEKPGKKADKIKTVKEREESITTDEARELEKSLGGADAAPTVKKTAKPSPPLRLKRASPLLEKESRTRQQEKKEAFQDQPSLQAIRLENGVTGSPEKNWAWSQANLLNQQIQVHHAPIPSGELSEIFKQSIDLTHQLKEAYKNLKQEAAETGKIEKLEAFVQGVVPLITIKSSKDAVDIHPNIGYFLSRCIPGSLEYRFFNLARSGWCLPRGECYHLEKKKGLVGDLKAKQTATVAEASSDNQLLQWEKLYPQLSGVYREIASHTMENRKKTPSPPPDRAPKNN